MLVESDVDDPRVPDQPFDPDDIDSQGDVDSEEDKEKQLRGKEEVDEFCAVGGAGGPQIMGHVGAENGRRRK